MRNSSPPLEVGVARWIEVMRRNLLLASIVALGVFGIATVVIAKLPNVYRAETRILVNPQRISDKYVSSTVSMGPAERLNTLSQQILSTSRLEAITTELNLYPKERQELGRDRVIDLMRNHITIDLKQSSDGPSAFTISYTGGSAQEVATVTNRLAASFIDWNLRDREQEAQGTTLFLEKELATSKSELDALEERLRVYKVQHLGQLPNELDANLQTLSRLQVQLQANSDAQNRLDQQALLSRSGSYDASGEQGENPQAGLRSQLVARDVQAHRDLAELRSHYTSAHPDVISKEAEVASLDTQLTQTPASVSSRTRRSGSVASPADAQEASIHHSRDRLAAEQHQIESSINNYQFRVNGVPIREQEISQLLRDYDTAKEHYRSLLEKTYTAQMSMELERGQEGGSFTLLDPAQVPDAPIGPNRPVLYSMFLVASLVAGLLVIILRERLDSTVKSDGELHDILPHIPVLGLIPRISKTIVNHSPAQPTLRRAL
ncbi:GumC family protein [Granulicella mallensis]|uniref:Lipopolysaccharide biosynthesis protein n=1 Tax=Granulicella mallensis (strain ATCC BAA-1857 / DSM 23137 / MP5ACTX8) TaxID=682795 RepID=G8NXD2_GRAMM|nr:GNVR domain-containing protein [Granulicella mallensis]AEU37839.1 lipopolysaccharide biosynthesis protein [Granulicella mallensis MP5ACTX8]